MTRIIVVGGGVVGMLTARELTRSNLDVILVERGELAQESSWAGGGILSPLYPWRYPDSVTTLASWSQAFYPELCTELRQHTGIDPECLHNGMLVMAPADRQLAESWAATHGHSLQSITPEDLSQLEPELQNPPHGAIWMPKIGQVRNPRLAKALAADIESRGVSIMAGSTVIGLQVANGRIKGIELKTGPLEADAVVICAGAWTAELLKPHVSRPDIHPVRGQMLLFKADPGLIHRIVLEDSRYAIPRRDGRILFGSTLEETGFEKTTTEAAHLELYSLAIQRFPALKNYPVEKHWAGLRPGSPGGVPYITAHPELDGLYINAGHFRNGLVLAPASARLMSNIITGEPLILPPEPYGFTAQRN